MITFRHFNSIMEAIVLYLKYTTARARHNAQASSHLMMATSGGNENSTEQIALSLLGKACMRMDLITIHDIMMAVQYDDDSVGELSFRGWTINMQNILNARKHGDLAFQDKDFGMAILWYNRVIDSHLIDSPTVYARRSLAYLYCGLPDRALLDAMKAHCLKNDWPTAFYLQAVALIKLEMKADATDMLEEGASLENMRRNFR
ncbi:serine/threonine-protein kinase BSK1 [Cryptomeria japonica]|uniref:serine/threonine-protein kinase BSK1 n=1 Tax=Cryptomeria japonica TaxID=3369 RepID=UPI0025AD57A7|nr:serine/threonine-protein kinase BSK1 [Cryptomeria japonica]